MHNHQGWVKIHRELLDKVIWKNSTAPQKCVLLQLLMMVNHKENEWEFKSKKYKVQAGQCITSLKSITEGCGKGITTANVRSALNRFEKLGFLTNESTNEGRLITIVNWGLYQSGEKLTHKHVSNEITGTPQEPSMSFTSNNNEEIETTKRKEEEGTDFTPIANLLHKNGYINSFNIPFTILEDLKKIKLSFGFENHEAMITHAIEESIRTNGRTWKFIFNKLTYWNEYNLKSLQEVINHEKQNNTMDTLKVKPKANRSNLRNYLDDLQGEV